MRMARGVMWGVVAACWPLSAVAADEWDDMRAYIRAGLTEQSVPSIAVAVAKDGKILWEQGFGWADRERRIVATEHTPYSLASISKPLTTTALMTLVQAGKIDLDRPINDYLGDAKLVARVGDAGDATVRRVANHTSGLPLHVQFFYADEPYARPSPEETILRYGNLVTRPGETYEYSNLGFGVLDHLIERVSGESYAQFMRSRVFMPLGMTRSSVDIGPGLAAFAATRYDATGAPLPFYDFDHPGASAVFASAHDLVRYGMFHLKAHLRDQQGILSDASIDEMHRRTSGTEDEGYAIGFQTARRNGYRVVGHTGSMGGVNTQMQLFPDQQLAIVVLSNGRSSLPKTTFEQLAHKPLPGWPRPANQAVQPQPAFTAVPELTGTWKGTLHTYTRDQPVAMTFQPGGDIHVRIGEQLTTLVNSARFKDGVLNGVFAARIGTPDTERYDYTVLLSLRLRGQVLNGSATAVSVRDKARTHAALAHWLELSKQ
ncbi:serine hydrolase domain-containing protein [Steroidobacter sp.]|uniref:serine hydrolase domain-containing protein n=1 Tax=Steroidobacter sp. TaxID=1978227 RepID=UPI0025E6451C|nr:serine hydrolase domain-containing protein [Steroidobacter sp.]